MRLVAEERFALREREPWKKEPFRFPLNKSKAADEELLALKRENLEKGSFPLNENRRQLMKAFCIDEREP